MNKLDVYSDMLFESAKAIFEVVKNPELSDKNKMLIASANALTTTTKTAIQNEILKYKLDNSNGTVLKLLEKIDE